MPYDNFTKLRSFLVPDTDPSFIFDAPRYSELAVKNADSYQNADPFPHIVLNDFIDIDVSRHIASAFPKPEDADDWVICDHNNAQKRYQHDETFLPIPLRRMLREFNSRQFLLFLETLTGIENLIPDPYFIGGGAHISGTGDFLKIHADFNWHDKLLLHRRINAIVYFNEDWDENWGGELELWDKAMTSAVVKIAPHIGRIAIFNVDQDSNHGHPHPLKTPKDTYRKALNLYYYTRLRDEAEIHDPHFTLYKTQSPFAIGLGDTYRNRSNDADE